MAASRILPGRLQILIVTTLAEPSLNRSRMPFPSRRAVAARGRTIAARFGKVRVAVRHRLLAGPALLDVLLVSDELAYTSEQQFAPMTRHAAALQRRFGAVVRHVALPGAMKLAQPALAGVAVLGLKLSFTTAPDEALRIARHFRGLIEGSATRLVYFDGDDDLCIQWPQLLEQVHAYVKKHVFANSAAYGCRYSGKSNLTDYVVRRHGRSFETNEIPSAGPVPANQLSKLHLGWNIGLDDKIAALVHTLPPIDASTKDVDVACRAFVKEDVWIYPLRGPLVERIAALEGRFRVLAPRERVSQAQYYDEMTRARICVSPFGYGELCWRDFEALLCGCMLVKPDMSHVRTWPDIFVAGETYAPVRWDYADLAEVCARYLDDEPARRRMAERARAVLIEALGEAAFVETFGTLLTRLAAYPRAD